MITLKLNIGLSRHDGGRNSVATTGEALRFHGFAVRDFFRHVGTWQGAPEITLVLSVETTASNWRDSIASLASALNQECIACICDGVGELIPPVYPFDSNLFIRP